jgi:ubiquinone/menaquinone biosynthesis C-methylase UbiE
MPVSEAVHTEPLHAEHLGRASRTYGSAADHYTRPSLAFWNRYGAETVARIGLRAGDAVLDLCSGAGASAIPAANAVGPQGRVLAVDAAGPLLELARERAAREGLANVEFRLGDASATELESGSFAAVICVFGVFFVPDMASFVAEMWRLVGPGGTLAITTWGPRLFEPGNSAFWDAVRSLEPALYKSFNPWDEITTPSALEDLLARGGVPRATTEAADGEQALSSPDDFWDVVLGSGYRATVDALGAEQRAALREAVIGVLREQAVTSIRTDVVFATATKPTAD